MPAFHRFADVESGRAALRTHVFFNGLLAVDFCVQSYHVHPLPKTMSTSQNRDRMLRPVEFMAAEHRYRNKTERDADAWAIDTIRTLAMDAVEAAKSGHPGTPMALAPLVWAIFSKLRKHDPRNPDWIDRDRFVLSCGHASMLQYGALFCSGYDITLNDIKNFRQWQSKTPGHPEAFHTPGVEITTGPLGQGIASAVGMAMAERHLAARFNTEQHTIFDHRVWVIASDGDLMEGVSAEAASLAGHLKLNKICAFWDDNSITIDGRTDLSFSEDVLKRYQAYGWHTLTVEEGEDLQAIVAAGKEAIASDKPTMVRIKTVIGFPAPTLSDSPKSHGAPLGEDEIKKTKEIMNWPQEKFFVPQGLSAATEEVRTRGGKRVQHGKPNSKTGERRPANKSPNSMRR